MKRHDYQTDDEVSAHKFLTAQVKALTEVREEIDRRIRVLQGRADQVMCDSVSRIADEPENGSTA
jgi:hypothetical protein